MQKVEETKREGFAPRWEEIVFACAVFFSVILIAYNFFVYMGLIMSHFMTLKETLHLFGLTVAGGFWIYISVLLTSRAGFVEKDKN